METLDSGVGAILYLGNKPKYECPIHGQTTYTVASNIPDHQGIWCQICAIDSLDRIGVSRMKEIINPPTENTGE